MSSTLCDICREQEATVFVTKVLNNKTTKQRLCESCARRRAGEGWLQQGGELGMLLPGVTGEIRQDLPLDEIVRSLFDQVEFTEEEAFQADASLDAFSAMMQAPGEFPADEDAVDEMEEALAEELESSAHSDPDLPLPWAAPRNIASVRCPKCGTTWDRLRQDGRVGCVECYKVFQDQLGKVMERLQQSAQHIGKRPRTADKRRRRLEHLRARRDHRLAMLQRRLQEAISTENYEEAAKIRDKIKIVSSTIVASPN